jgi:hypothetical protein
MKARILITLLCVLGFVGALPTAASAEVSPTAPLPPGIAWTASVDGSPITLHERTDGTSFTTTSQRGAKPLFLNPVQWFQCETVNNASYLIKNYPVKPGGGYTSSSVRFFCGTSASGYLHVSQHAGEWQVRVNTAGGGTNWDDLMDYGTSQALAHPTRTINQGDQKTCFETPVTIVKANGSSFSFYTTVVVSQNNRLLITSFPPSSPNC